MPDILGIYILDEQGKALFSEEFFEQSSKEADKGLFCDFITAFQQFASELGSSESALDNIELGGNKILFTTDSISGVKFILRCDKKVKMKKFGKVLNQIKNTFITIFEGSLHKKKEDKRDLTSKFEKELDEIIQKHNDVADFLKIL